MIFRNLSPARVLPCLALSVTLCACHKEEDHSVSSIGGKPSGIVSAEKTSFDEVTSKLDKGGNLYVYLSTEQTLGGLSAKLAGISNMMTGLPGGAQTRLAGNIFGFADSWLRDSGIEEISGVGLSSIAREPGFYYSKLIVHHYPGQNQGVMWSMLGKEPHTLEGLNMLPEETVLASFTDLDLSLLWRSIQDHFEKLDLPAARAALNQVPEQFQKGTGLDWNTVLSSLGGNYGFILTMDPEKKVTLPLPGHSMDFPSPALALVVKVTSDVIFDRVAELGKDNPLVGKIDGPDLRMRTVTIPIPLPLDLRPSIARSGDLLILASSDTLVRQILDVKSGKLKGFKSTPEFAHLSQGVPDVGNNFALVARRFMTSMADLQQQALTNKGNMNPDQASAFANAFRHGTNFGNFTVGLNGPTGWEGYGNGSQSLQSMILPAVAGVVAASAIALPMIKAHQMATKGATSQVVPAPASPRPPITAAPRAQLKPAG
jgi:hypothetical protein